MNLISLTNEPLSAKAESILEIPNMIASRQTSNSFMKFVSYRYN